eukprot:CAMPEP_0205923226 /NCGR_PEP_ID=MMETSP1325-20131115/15852_1 /ASSEMBLY_ACC=CAM_ASM_000708 /TAXON_ID=236786 /ORGANISM="Florenciella sp., Strain RCC1007" /LENGTH=256 /DNA_ID=CAMNT_0053291405 /DNA_START=30 /DNA_END=800 /DNA_ORIENTATION=-
MLAKTTAILATLATSVSAFTPTTPSMAISLPKLGKKGGRSVTPTIPEEEKPLTERLGGVGVSRPYPEGFDPLGFASRANAQDMIKFREAELKHGRVAMLAVPGFLLSEDFHPFFPSLPKWEFGIFALQDTLEQPPALVAFAGAILAIASFEARSFKSWEVPEGTPGSEASTYFKMKTDIVPGATLPAGPWTQDKLSPEEFLSKQTAELNNGRLAMIAIALIVLQEVTSKLPAAEFDVDTLNFIGSVFATPGDLFGL